MKMYNTRELCIISGQGDLRNNLVSPFLFAKGETEDQGGGVTLEIAWWSVVKLGSAPSCLTQRPCPAPPDPLHMQWFLTF